jgi:SAM-dependent methyltransferase
MQAPQATSLYADGRIYDRLFAGHSAIAEVQFCRSLTDRQGAKLLELACGTGRATVPLAQEGFNVTGVDNSAPMLVTARLKAADAGVAPMFQLADMRKFDLPSRYDLIYLANNSLGHLTTSDDFQDTMQRVRGHLDDDGVFVIDYFNPSLTLLNRPDDVDFPVTSFADDSVGLVTVSERVRYDNATQINHVRWRLSSEHAGDQFLNFSMRVYFPAELDSALSRSGLKVLAKYGSFMKTPFSSASRQQVIVCANAA